jgi:oxalate decarboxylase/phosphoglucose isomerase-like protein (cupin superfamily)
MSRIQLLTPDINDKAVDHRGAIYSYIPYDSIVEFVYIDTKAGVTRGHHYHTEFDEYIMLVHGEGIYLEPLADGATRKIVMAPGFVVYIPANTAHTFVPLSDCKSVSFLTKRWDDCANPITPIK